MHISVMLTANKACQSSGTNFEMLLEI